MDNKQTRVKIEKVLSGYLPSSALPLELNTNLKDNIDSLTMMEIAFALEEEFSINIPDEKLRELTSFEDVISGVEELRGTK